MTDLLNEKLRLLTEKYGVEPGRISGSAGKWFVEAAAGGRSVLLPHRVERRFQELKNIVNNGTLEELSTLRFANMSAGGDVRLALEREIDLAAWLAGSPVKSAFATADGGKRTVNALFKLVSGVSVCIECSNLLPAGRPVMDRHEIIAARGVASDRVVDTQVPQSSIYLIADGAAAEYTDVDSELFGLSEFEVTVVRAAFALLVKPELAGEWNRAAGRAAQVAAACLESVVAQRVVEFEEEVTK
ncbi:MAG: hypothetical protein PHI85_02145 [Victivallaceae bacterium]|nr:hypothetical protein [Victivallaceae bacterium]